MNVRKKKGNTDYRDPALLTGEDSGEQIFSRLSGKLGRGKGERKNQTSISILSMQGYLRFFHLP